MHTYTHAYMQLPLPPGLARLVRRLSNVSISAVARALSGQNAERGRLGGRPIREESVQRRQTTGESPRAAVQVSAPDQPIHPNVHHLVGTTVFVFPRVLHSTIECGHLITMFMMLT